MWPTQTAFRLVFAFLSRLGVKPGSVDCQASALPQNHPHLQESNSRPYECYQCDDKQALKLALDLANEVENNSTYTFWAVY